MIISALGCRAAVEIRCDPPRGLRSFLAHPRLFMGNRAAVHLLGGGRRKNLRSAAKLPGIVLQRDDGTIFVNTLSLSLSLYSAAPPVLKMRRGHQCSMTPGPRPFRMAIR